MPRKIFLDIGAHWGETLNYIKSTNEFDEIHSFEICKENCIKYLDKYKSDKIFIHNFGLLDYNGEIDLYNPGSDGASIYKEKSANGGFAYKSKYNVVKTSEWFKKNIKSDDIVIMKVNCEGSECKIILDLLDNNEYDKITFTIIWLDILKCGKNNLKKNFEPFLDKIKSKNNYLFGQHLVSRTFLPEFKNKINFNALFPQKAGACFTIYNLIKKLNFDLYKVFDKNLIKYINKMLKSKLS